MGGVRRKLTIIIEVNDRPLPHGCIQLLRGGSHFVLFSLALFSAAGFQNSFRMPPRKRKTAPEPEPPASDLEPSKMKVAELKEELTKRGLEISGKKADLMARLEEAMELEDDGKIIHFCVFHIKERINEADL